MRFSIKVRQSDSCRPVLKIQRDLKWFMDQQKDKFAKFLDSPYSNLKYASIFLRTYNQKNLSEEIRKKVRQRIYEDLETNNLRDLWLCFQTLNENFENDQVVFQTIAK